MSKIENDNNKMGVNWSGEFSPESSTSEYFICEIRTNLITLSHISSDWNSCKEYIINTYKSLRSIDSIDLNDEDVQSLEKDLKLNGWTERTYIDSGIVRSSIRDAKSIFIKATYDNPSDDKRVTLTSENIISKYSDELVFNIIKELLEKILDPDMNYDFDLDLVDKLKKTYAVSGIHGSPPYYILIEMLIE
jgi:hypothetical protein